MRPETVKAITEYVEWVYAECLGEDEGWPLGEAYRNAGTLTERSHIAAAIVYRTHALCDAPYRILGERGELADPRLCVVADDLRLS